MPNQHCYTSHISVFPQNHHLYLFKHFIRCLAVVQYWSFILDNVVTCWQYNLILCMLSNKSDCLLFHNSLVMGSVTFWFSLTYQTLVFFIFTFGSPSHFLNLFKTNTKRGGGLSFPQIFPFEFSCQLFHILWDSPLAATMCLSAPVTSINLWFIILFHIVLMI